MNNQEKGKVRGLSEFIGIENEIRRLDLSAVRRVSQLVTPEDVMVLRRRNGDIKTTTTEEIISKLKKEIKDLQEEVLRLRKMSLTDEKTSLGNQRKYAQDIKGMISRHLRETKDNRKNKLMKPKGFELVVIDGNGVKKINDTYGHQVGDNAIIRLSTAISRTIRAYDHAYRIGSGADEFVIILETDKVSSQSFINRLNKELKEINKIQNNEFNKIGLPKINVTFADGTAHVDEILAVNKPKVTLEIIERELFRLAEKRMYNKKTQMKR